MTQIDNAIKTFTEKLQMDVMFLIHAESVHESDRILGRIEGIADCAKYLLQYAKEL